MENGVARPKSILLLGLPRSGTTWVGDILAQANAVRYVFEPDNEKTSLLARWYKREVGRFPMLQPGQYAPRYAALWRHAVSWPAAHLLSRSWLTRACLPQGPLAERHVARKEARLLRRLGARPGHGSIPRPDGLPHRADADGSPSPVRLVKSVHGVLAAQWIAHAAPFDEVVVVMRHPLAILASWRRLKMPDAARPTSLSAPVVDAVFAGMSTPPIDPHDPLQLAAMHLAVLWRGLQASLEQNKQWLVVTHEQLCKDVSAKFENLFAQLNLPFSPAVQKAIAARNKQGEGYRAHRVASQEIGKWRKDFTDDELKTVMRILDACDLGEWVA
jgi:hypothetical protein